MLALLFLFLFSGCGRKVDVSDTSDTYENSKNIRVEETSSSGDAKKTAASSGDAKASAGGDKASIGDAKASKGEADKDDKSGKSGKSSSDKKTSKKKNGKIVVLDPGHSSVVSGETEPIGPGSGEYKAKDATGTRGTASGLTEYELNFQIAVKLRTELENRGYTVILTREDNDTQISCAERAKVANDAGADIFIRIHADGLDDSSARGALGICISPSNPYVPEMYSESRILTDLILDEYVAETGLSSRGVWERDDMTGNNWSKMPSTLLELGFMTNSEEDLLMADPEFQVKMVNGIANGVDKYFFTD